METSTALIFTAYMVPVNFVDNILKADYYTRGLKTPMWVIIVGVIGGTLSNGIIGLFVGPIVLAVTWDLFGHFCTRRRHGSNLGRGLHKSVGLIESAVPRHRHIVA